MIKMLKSYLQRVQECEKVRKYKRFFWINGEEPQYPR